MSLSHRSVLVLGTRLERLRGVRSALPRRQLINRVETLPLAELLAELG